MKFTVMRKYIFNYIIMKHNNIVPLIFLVLFFSCTPHNKAKDEKATHSVKLTDAAKTDLAYSDIIHVDEWIVLDTLDECIIGDVAKIEEFNNEYYILDKVIQKCVLVFGKDGKYLRRIGRFGQGPGEYAQLCDFTVNKQTGHIAILTGQSNVYLYSPTGEFQKSKRVSQATLWDITNNGSVYLMSSRHNTQPEDEGTFLLYAFDNDLNLKGKWGNVLPDKMPALPFLSSALQTIEDNIYYCDIFTNSIYKYTHNTNSVTKVYDLSFAAPMPTDVFADAMRFIQNQRDYDFINEAIATSDNMLIGYIRQGRHHVAEIDPEGGIVKNGPYSGRFPKTFHGNGNELLSPVSADEYLSYWAELPIPHCGTVSSEGNFVIMKWTKK